MLNLHHSSPRRRRPATLAGAALAVGLAACGGSEPPAIDLLAHGAAPDASFPARDLELPGTEHAVRLEPSEGGRGYWIETTIAAGAWRAAGVDGVYWSERPLPGAGRPREGAARGLRGPDGAYVVAPKLPSELSTREGVPGAFVVQGGRVLVARPPEAGPPGRCVLRELHVLRRSDGVAARAPVDELVADGLPLVPGKEEVLPLDAPAESMLSFWTSGIALGEGADGAAAQAVVRLTLDGEPLFEHALAATPELTSEHHTLPLPPGGVRDGRLVATLEGASALVALHVPRVHPREVGTPDARPWDSERPDLVLLLLDTFRADNMATYGGDARLTPQLDALAARARVFERAVSNAPWTLPSHASLLSGLLPYQADCVERRTRLDREAVVLAEELRRIGYRTVAITDGVFVSQDYGFAQGFEWFYEKSGPDRTDFGETVALVEGQLAADDGRPLFLFVHSYRVHDPYVVSQRTRAALGEQLGIAGDFEQLVEELGRPGHMSEQGDLTEFVARAEPLYRGAAHDLDRGVGRLVDLLEERGVLPGGRLLVTSDHGEAFGEHGRWGHGSQLYEEQVRVPLFVLGEGIEPGRDATPASLVDVAPTLVAAAGFRPASGWVGRDLLAPETPEERALFTFVGRQQGDTDPQSMAVVADGRKAILRSVLDPEGPWEVYDLADDPRERADRGDEPWAAAFAEEFEGDVEWLTTPRLQADRVELSKEAERRIEELGYGG